LKKGTAFPLILAAFLAIAVLYAPQPLLPRFARMYDITETRAALIVAVVLFPLSVAPLSFGALLQRLPSADVLRGSMGVLAILVAAQAFAPSFMIFVGLRLLQGVAVAAILTALMTYIATFAEGGTMPRIMAWYVAATILGGFMGRMLAGLTVAYASWVFFSLALSAAIALGGVALSRLERHPPSDAQATSDSDARFRDVLQVPRYVRTYALIFCLYFGFSAFMNFLPFRLQVVHPGASELLTGLLYGGYVVGIGVSIKAPALARWIGGEAKAAWWGTAVGLSALLVARIEATEALFGAVVLMCIAMFMTHSIAAGWINRAGGSRGSLINGLYVAVYYAGGVLGAYVPGFAYERSGWGAFLLVLATMLVGAQIAAIRWWWTERAASSEADV
jgi:YNFM family putative membrane transporter